MNWSFKLKVWFNSFLFLFYICRYNTYHNIWAFRCCHFAFGNVSAIIIWTVSALMGGGVAGYMEDCTKFILSWFWNNLVLLIQQSWFCRSPSSPISGQYDAVAEVPNAMVVTLLMQFLVFADLSIMPFLSSKWLRILLKEYTLTF